MPRDLVAYAEPAVVADPGAEVLLRAADIIERRGHYKGFFCQNTDGPDFGPVCLWGAINLAYGLAPYEGVPIGVSVAVQARLGFKRGELADWNDMPARTKAEVIARLREAARQ